MEYVVCYDISDDARRSRVSAALLDFGTRVQESVFVAHLDDELAERMRERLGRLVDVYQDKVHIFVLCAACDARTSVIGEGEIVRDPEWYII